MDGSAGPGEESDSSGKASNGAVTSSCYIIGVSFLWLSQWFSILVVHSITKKLKISVPRRHPRPFKQNLQRAENNIRIVREAPQVTSTCSQGSQLLLPALLSPYSFCGNAATLGTVFWKVLWPRGRARLSGGAGGESYTAGHTAISLSIHLPACSP